MWTLTVSHTSFNGLYLLDFLLYADLPKSIEITGPTTAEPGETLHLSCLAAAGFPAPALKWRIEKSGDVEEVSCRWISMHRNLGRW